MNKEEILAMSRNENKGKDIEQLEINSRASAMGAYVATGFAALLFIAEFLITHGKINCSIWAVVTVLFTTTQIYKYAKQKKTPDLISAILWTIASVVVTTAAILSLIIYG